MFGFYLDKSQKLLYYKKIKGIKKKWEYEFFQTSTRKFQFVYKISEEKRRF